jgi:RNA polymerase sigma-70 factor, ECF subfamily
VTWQDGASAFTDFYLRSRGRLATQLFFVLGDPDEADECLQEAYAAAWLRWERLRKEAAEPAAWVYTVAYRIAINRWRRRKVHARAVRRALPTATGREPSVDTVAVRDALTRLPHGQRAVLVLHYYQGLRVDEIAQILGLSSSGVKSRLARGRAALLPLLDDGRTGEQRMPPTHEGIQS